MKPSSLRVCANELSIRDMCEKANTKVCNDLTISNLGPHVEQHVRVLNGPFEIDELYCSDSLQAIPNVLSGLVDFCIF